MKRLRWPLLAVLALTGTQGCIGPNAAQKAATARWCVDWMVETAHPVEGGVACPRPEHEMEQPMDGVVVCRCRRPVPAEAP